MPVNNDRLPERDPLMSPRECWEDLGISKVTWYRVWRPRMQVVQVSARRVGIPRSAHLAARAALTKPAPAAA